MGCKPDRPTQSLRILIVDNSHPHGLDVEQKLNLLGYLQIALSRQLNELTAPIISVPIWLVKVSATIADLPHTELLARVMRIGRLSD